MIGQDVFLSDAALVLLAEKRRRQKFKVGDRKTVVVPVFRGAALAAQTMTDHELVLAGPSETGKTVGLTYKLDSMLRATPGARAVILRKVRQDMGNTVLKTWERIIAIRGGVTAYGGGHPERYEYANGSQVHVIGMDRPGAVLSGEYDFIFVNQAEELTLDAWETLATRCTGRGVVTKTPQLMGDCNPGPPTHWLLKRRSLTLLHSRHEDNPALFNDDGSPTEQWTQRTLPVLDALTGVRKDRYRYGRWVSAEGVVYESFSRGVHVIPRSALPVAHRYIASVDWGHVHPVAIQVWMLDSDSRMYLVAERYMTRSLIGDWVEWAKEFQKRYRPEVFVCDPSEPGFMVQFRNEGLPAVPANNAVSVGIQAVQARLTERRLFIVEDALVERDEELARSHKPTCLTDELEVYSWRKSGDGQPLREEPLKVNDDACDSARYAVVYADLITRHSDSGHGAAEAGRPTIYSRDDDYSGGGWGDE